MTSTQGVTLDTNVLGQVINYQLGAATQRRGVRAIDGVIYPEFVGVYIDEPFYSKLLTRDEVIEIFFNKALTPASFVTDGVTFLGPTDQAVEFAYPGVYRVRIQIAYSSFTLSTTLRLAFEVGNNGVFEVIAVDKPLVFGDRFIYFDQILTCDRIQNVTVTNIMTSPAIIQSSANPFSEVETFIEIEYLGAI